ncbi:hypothetical protein [Pelagibacterium mangrovi]|uniref:hypothetical protein n=1 Tax=Pelagibacterium mangrovi TaxID=3119828 RepID=UPI002FC911D3
MNRPDDIPQDVWDAAEIATIGWVRTEDDGSPEATFDNFVGAIARAILAERERNSRTIVALERRLHLLAVVADEAITLIENAINDDGSMTDAITSLRGSMAKVSPGGAA